MSRKDETKLFIIGLILIIAWWIASFSVQVYFQNQQNERLDSISNLIKKYNTNYNKYFEQIKEVINIE